MNTSMNVEEMMAVLAKEDTEGQPDSTNAAGETKEGSSEVSGDEGGEQQ